MSDEHFEPYADAGSAEEFWLAHEAALVEASRASALSLFEEAKSQRFSDPIAGELSARRALEFAVRAYWYAEGGPEAEAEHLRLHQIGAWTRSAFGCLLDYTGSEYKTSCPVKLGDKRLGLSVGYLAKRWCSICNQNLTECEHRRDRLYWVPGGPTEFGACRVCRTEACSHTSNRLYVAPVIPVIKHIDALEEVSLVEVPALPLARLTSLPISPAELSQLLGPDFAVGVEVSCDHCLLPYHGLPERIKLAG